MDNLELQKTANEVRKGIVTAVYSAKSGHPADLYLRRTSIHIFILKR